MRKLWPKIQLLLVRWLGLRPVILTIGTKTQFRGRKNRLLLPEWENLAVVFERVPDLEDYLQIQIEGLAGLIKNAPITPDGDRQRLVLQSQWEVLENILNLPEIAKGKISDFLKPKRFSTLKGQDHVSQALS